MPIIRANDIDIYYEIHGEGEPVVLIAGLNSDHTLYRGIIPQLAARHKVVALQHPSRVKSLILVSTVMKSLKGAPMTWSRRLIPLMLKIPMIRGPHPYYAVARQPEASRDYDCMDRLGEIQVPTLILHGKKDKIAPYRLAEAMQSGIKGSQMLTFHGGHLFFIVRQKQFIDAIVDFLGSLKTSSGQEQSTI